MTWLFQSVNCVMRNSNAPASRSSCRASVLPGVFPFVGGPGEKPMGNTLRPLTTRTLFDVRLTTELVWAESENEAAKNAQATSVRIPDFVHMTWTEFNQAEK